MYVRVCGCVWACVRVMRVGCRGVGVRSGAVVKTTAAHHKVAGSNPTRKVYTPFLVAFPPFRTLFPPRSCLGNPQFPRHLLIARTHTHTHTHTHYTHAPLLYTLATHPSTHLSYHILTGARTRARGLSRGLHTPSWGVRRAVALDYALVSCTHTPLACVQLVHSS